MENLEKQIINRLNKVLNKYNLAIIYANNHNYKTTTEIDNILEKYCDRYVLVKIDKCFLVKTDGEIDNDITIIKQFYISWDNSKFVLLSSTYEYSIFDSFYAARNIIKQYNDRGIGLPEIYVLFDKLYNELHSLNNCSCLEELMIKMDLMGI